MPLITYVQPEGVERTVDVPVGWTAMEGAVRNGIRGIIAVCNGRGTCVTCHVHVDATWIDRLDKPTPRERELLNNAADKSIETSRISCFVLITADMDGLRLNIARRQV